MKTVLALVLALCTALPAVFAAGKSEASERATGVQTGGATELVVWADELSAPVLEGAGARFSADRGDKVRVQTVALGNMLSRVATARAAGDGPDVFVGAHTWLGDLVSGGEVAPIDAGGAASKFMRSALDALTYDGRLYGLPFSVENVAFIYNRDLVGGPPKDWNEVAAVAARLENDGIVRYGFVREEGDPYTFFPIQTAFGGYVFGRRNDATYDVNDVGFDDAGSIGAAGWLQRMVRNGHIPSGLDYDSVVTMFAARQVAMIVAGPWALDRLDASGVNYAVAAIPGRGKPFVGVQGFMLGAAGVDQSLATDFLTRFVARTDVMLDLYRREGRPPAYMDALNAVDDSRLKTFGKAGAEGLPIPAVPQMDAVWTPWGDAIKGIMEQQVGGEDAYRAAAQRIREAIGGQ